MKIINDNRRKILRYLMFAKKNNVKLESPIISRKVDKDIIKYYEQHPDFTSWDDFETKWDIGMGDDIVAATNRRDKWFLVDRDKSEIVFRPEDYWEKEARRRGISTHALYTEQCYQRGITLSRFFELFF